MKKFPFFVLSSFAALALCACGGPKQSWTIEQVQPPPSLQEALIKIDAERYKEAFQEAPVTPLTVTRDGAILTALSRNRSLEVERYNPDIRRTFIDEQRSVFDLELLATVTAGRANNRSFDARGNERTDTTDSIDITQSGTKRLTTGTEITLSGTSSQTNPEFGDQSAFSQQNIKVSQSLLRGRGEKVNLVSIRKAENDTEISSQAFRDTVLNLIQQVEEAYWSLVLSRETVRIRKAALDSANEQLRGFELRMELGSATQSDVLSAQANVATRNSELIDAEGNEQISTLNLLRLISPETPEQWSAVIQATDSPDVTYIAQNQRVSAELAQAYRPDLAQARLQFSNSELDLIQTKNGLLPRLDGFINYGSNGYGGALGESLTEVRSQEYNEYSGGVELQFNPGNRRARALNLRAEFAQQQAEASIANLEEQIHYQIQTDIVNAEVNYKQILASEKLLESRKEQLRAITARQEAGSATILDVLNVQNDVISAEVETVRNRIEYITSLTALYRDEGTLLDRRGIGLASLTEPRKTDQEPELSN